MLQLLPQRYSRRLITMEKVERYDASRAAAHRAAAPDPTLPVERIHAKLYGEEYERDEKGRPIVPDEALNKQRFRGKMV